MSRVSLLKYENETFWSDSQVFSLALMSGSLIGNAREGKEMTIQWMLDRYLLSSVFSRSSILYYQSRLCMGARADPWIDFLSRALFTFFPLCFRDVKKEKYNFGNTTYDLTLDSQKFLSLLQRRHWESRSWIINFCLTNDLLLKSVRQKIGP